MRLTTVRRSLAAAAAILLLTVPTVFAETVASDWDLITAGPQNVRDLGTVQPGADVNVDVYFVLTCSGSGNHVDSNQAIKLTPGIQSIPRGGGFRTGTVLFGLSGAWPADGQPCPADTQPAIGGPLHMIVTAPTTPGLDYRYWFTWNMGVTPASANDAGIFEGSNPEMTFILDVPGAADTTPPTLNLPTTVTAEATSAAGAAVIYSASATDANPANPAVSCSPPSGSTFAIATTTVNCSATDAAGNTASGSFSVIVQDTTPPQINGTPGAQTAEATGPAGAVVTYTDPTATDLVDGARPVLCSPSSGSAFALGSTVVTCSSSDTRGNTAQSQFTVTVQDTTAPILIVPADITAEATGSAGAAVTFATSATDVVDGSITPLCDAASGATFPLGTTTVTCTATDTAGHSATGSFDITVEDTTAPTLVGMPGDQSLSTSNPAGTTVTYAPPTATDLVDPSPTVACAPASGSQFPVGDTQVTCTARDASSNSSSASFAVHVTLLQVTGATWEDPVGAEAGVVVNGSRTIPVKVQLLLDGSPVTAGSGLLLVVPCAGGAPVMTDDLTVQSNGRWMGHLSTDGMAQGCYRVVATVDGRAFGSFRLDIRNDSSTVTKPAKTPKK